MHPYPVTPFHGDYLHHADLAEAAKARLARQRTMPAPSSEKLQGAGGGRAGAKPRPARVAADGPTGMPRSMR